MNQLIFDFAPVRLPGFDTFLGASNAELVYVLQNRRDQFVYVWGVQGAGKSHLLKAWAAKASEEGKKAVYIDAASSPLTEAVMDADCLAVDQVEKLDEAEQALLFAVFNRFRNSGSGFLLLGSELPPQQLVVREDLRTRMAYCPVYEVRPLSDEEKADALVEMAAARQLTVDKDIILYLLRHWRRDMDSLIQMLETLDNYAVAVKRKITLPLLRQLLKQQEAE